MQLGINAIAGSIPSQKITVRNHRVNYASTHFCGGFGTNSYPIEQLQTLSSDPKNPISNTTFYAAKKKMWPFKTHPTKITPKAQAGKSTSEKMPFVIGNNVAINGHCSIPCYYADTRELKIGRNFHAPNTDIKSGALYLAQELFIGDNASVNYLDFSKITLGNKAKTGTIIAGYLKTGDNLSSKNVVSLQSMLLGNNATIDGDIDLYEPKYSLKDDAFPELGHIEAGTNLKANNIHSYGKTVLGSDADIKESIETKELIADKNLHARNVKAKTILVAANANVSESVEAEKLITGNNFSAGHVEAKGVDLGQNAVVDSIRCTGKMRALNGLDAKSIEACCPVEIGSAKVDTINLVPFINGEGSDTGHLTLNSSDLKARDGLGQINLRLGQLKQLIIETIDGDSSVLKKFNITDLRGKQIDAERISKAIKVLKRAKI